MAYSVIGYRDARFDTQFLEFGNVDPTGGTGDATANDFIYLGVTFKTNSAGSIDGIRFYQAPGSSGVHSAMLYSVPAGSLLAVKHTTTRAGKGWVEITFDTPYNVSANTLYMAVISVAKDAGNFYYYQNDAYFETARLEKGLTAVSHAESQNGSYFYSNGSPPAFPVNGGGKHLYWISPVFTPSASLTQRSIIHTRLTGTFTTDTMTLVLPYAPANSLVMAVMSSAAESAGVPSVWYIIGDNVFDTTFSLQSAYGSGFRRAQFGFHYAPNPVTNETITWKLNSVPGAAAVVLSLFVYTGMHSSVPIGSGDDRADKALSTDPHTISITPTTAGSYMIMAMCDDHGNNVRSVGNSQTNIITEAKRTVTNPGDSMAYVAVSPKTVDTSAIVMGDSKLGPFFTQVKEIVPGA